MTSTPVITPKTTSKIPTISPLPILPLPSLQSTFLETQLFNLPLPYLIFSNELELVSINKVGAGLFEGDQKNLGKKLNHFLCKEINNSNNESQIAQLKILRKHLETFANHTKASSTRRWYEGLALDYYTGSHTGTRSLRRSEVIVQFIPSPISLSVTGLLTPSDTPSTTNSTSSIDYYSILFVREVEIPITATSKLSHIITPIKTPISSPPLPASSPPPPPLATSSSASSSSARNRHIPRPLPESIAVLFPELPARLRQEKDDSHLDDPIKDTFKSGIGHFFDTIVDAPTESEYKLIIDSLPHICFTADENGFVKYFNKYWYDYTGIEPNTGLDTQLWNQFFHSDDMMVAISKWKHCLATGDPFNHEYRIRAVDGTWKWHAARSVALRDSTGAIHLWISTIIEIQELILSRNEAVRIQNSISAVLMGADIVLLSVDRSSIVTLFEGSPSAAVAVGIGSIYPDSSCIGKPLSTIWPDEALGTAVSKILDQNLGIASWLYEAEVVGAGKHYYRYRLVPLKGTSGKDLGIITGVVIVVADVTQLVTAENELQASKIAQESSMASEVAANEASRLKTEFVTNISHEIRTPIAAMIGICEILLDDTSLKESQRGLVEKSLRSGENLLDLVGMVLDMGKLVEAGKLQIEKCPFLLADVLDDAALFSVPAIHKGLKFVSDIGIHYTGILQGDRVRIRQVLANVLSNSIKFTKEGSITLTLRQESENDTECTFVFIIRDTGIGIQEHILPTLFVPFQQADTSTAREYGGSGLGLAISRNLVELMGGSLSLESIADIGTTMTISIPLEKLSNVTTLKVAPTVVQSTTLAPVNGIGSESWEGTKILIAEDNDLIRDIVTRILTKRKFSVTGVCDGLKAIEAVETGDFDLILMDGQMPKMDGYEASKAIRLLDDPCKSSIKIIALTASAFKGDKERCLSSGMNGYLAKPVRAKDLEAAIWDHLRGPSSLATQSQNM